MLHTPAKGKAQPIAEERACVVQRYVLVVAIEVVGPQRLVVGADTLV